MAAVVAVAVARAVEVLAVAVEVPLYQRHTNSSVSDLFATGICPNHNRT